MSHPDSHAVDCVRSFNRFYTEVIGVLRDGLLDSPYSLTEVRVLYELNARGCMPSAELRERLDLDAGYFSRILRRFEHEGLTRRERAEHDARRHVLQLTAKGKRAYSRLDKKSAAQVQQLLAGLTSENRQRLIASMQVIESTLREPLSRRSFVLRPLRSGDLGWVVHRHGVVYREEHGFDETFEALVARIIAEYVEQHDPKRDCGWIAEVDGAPAGSVFCVKKDKTSAQLRLLLVERHARGLGIGSALVQQCIHFARDAGYRSIMLWTNDILTDARRVYERAGFTLDRQEPHHNYGRDLVGQYWSRQL